MSATTRKLLAQQHATRRTHLRQTLVQASWVIERMLDAIDSGEDADASDAADLVTIAAQALRNVEARDAFRSALDIVESGDTR